MTSNQLVHYHIRTYVRNRETIVLGDLPFLHLVVSDHTSGDVRRQER